MRPAAGIPDFRLLPSVICISVETFYLIWNERAPYSPVLSSVQKQYSMRALYHYAGNMTELTHSVACHSTYHYTCSHITACSPI